MRTPGAGFRGQAENCGRHHTGRKWCQFVFPMNFAGAFATCTEENAMIIPTDQKVALANRFGLAPDAIFRLWRFALKDDESLLDEVISAVEA